MIILIAKTNTQVKIKAFNTTSTLNIAYIQHPKRYIIDDIVMAKNDKNMDCFIFILLPPRELTHGCVIAPLIIAETPKTKNPKVPP